AGALQGAHRARCPVSEQGAASAYLLLSRSTEVALDALLVLFAADAKRRFRSSFETLVRDRLAALLARTKRAISHPLECLLDLGQKDLLPASQPEGERLQVLAGGQVHLVRKVVRVQRHVLAQRLLRPANDLLPLFFESFFELF